MPRIRHTFIACLLIGAIITAPGADSTDSWTVRPDGIGPVHVGMTSPS
jgi:hypothetical protein